VKGGFEIGGSNSALALVMLHLRTRLLV
jgi:hypothetical protein